MSFRIGDARFTAKGQPGVIVEADKKGDPAYLSTDPEVLKENHRYGYINGLDPNFKAELNDVLDSVKDSENPEEKIAFLQEKIKESEQDPSQRRYTRYLKAELAHLINTFNIKPREFELPDYELSK